MIKIICSGKIKEKYLNDLISDYSNRINKYHKLEIIEIKDTTLKEEAKEIKKLISNSDYVISLAIEGKMINTIEFSKKIESLFNEGKSSIVFIIGSSEGIDEEIKKNSNELISFSLLTFPHGLFRGILLEQIYRSFKIINNETYHK